MFASPTFYIVLVTAFGSSILQNLFGFGYGVLVMSVLPYVLPYHQAAAASTLGMVLLAAIVAVRDRRHICFKVVWPALLGYLITSVTFILLAVGTSDAVLMRLLGIMLIATSIYMTFGETGFAFARFPETVLSRVCLRHRSGTVYHRRSAHRHLPAVLSENQGRIPRHHQLLFFYRQCCGRFGACRQRGGPAQTSRLASLCVCGHVAGSFAGNKIFAFISERTMRRAVYLFIALSGLTMIF